MAINPFGAVKPAQAAQIQQMYQPVDAISAVAGKQSGGNSGSNSQLAATTSGIANPNLKGMMYLGDGAVGGAALNLIG